MMKYLGKAFQDTFIIWTILTGGTIVSSVLYACLSIIGIDRTVCLFISLAMLLGIVATAEIARSKIVFLNKVIRTLGTLISVMLCLFFIILGINRVWMSFITFFNLFLTFFSILGILLTLVILIALPIIREILFGTVINSTSRRRTVLAAIIIMFIMLIFSLTPFIALSHHESESLQATVPTSTTVIAQIKHLGREVVSSTFEKVISYDLDQRSWQHFLGDTKKKLLVRGEVIAGFDLSMLNDKDIIIEGKTMKDASLTLNMQSLQILNVSIDEKETKIHDLNSGLYAPWNIGLNSATTVQVMSNMKGLLRNDACQAGILQRALGDTKSRLISFLKNKGFSVINIYFPPNSMWPCK